MENESQISTQQEIFEFDDRIEARSEDRDRAEVLIEEVENSKREIYRYELLVSEQRTEHGAQIKDRDIEGARYSRLQYESYCLSLEEEKRYLTYLRKKQEEIGLIHQVETVPSRTDLQRLTWNGSIQQFVELMNALTSKGYWDLPDNENMTEMVRRLQKAFIVYREDGKEHSAESLKRRFVDRKNENLSHKYSSIPNPERPKRQ